MEYDLWTNRMLNPVELYWRDRMYQAQGDARNFEDEWNATWQIQNLSPGWHFERRDRPQNEVATRDPDYIPFPSLCYRDGRYAHGYPFRPSYPRVGDPTPRGVLETPSAEGFPRNVVIQMRMRDQPDYGKIGDYYPGDLFGYDSQPYDGGLNVWGAQWGNYGWW